MANTYTSPYGLLTFVDLDGETIEKADGSSYKKYKLTLVLDPGTDIKPMQQIFDTAADDEFPTIPRKKLYTPISDAEDAVSEKTGEPYAGFAGKEWAIRFTSFVAPVVVDRNGNPIPASEVYSGARGRVQFIPKKINFVDQKGGKLMGIRFTMIGIQKSADGERLGGGLPAFEGFDNTEDK